MTQYLFKICLHRIFLSNAYRIHCEKKLQSILIASKTLHGRLNIRFASPFIDSDVNRRYLHLNPSSFGQIISASRHRLYHCPVAQRRLSIPTVMLLQRHQLMLWDLNLRPEILSFSRISFAVFELKYNRRRLCRISSVITQQSALQSRTSVVHWYKESLWINVNFKLNWIKSIRNLLNKINRGLGIYWR